MEFTQQLSGPGWLFPILRYFLSSFLTVQVTVNFLLMSLIPEVKSNKQRSQDSSGWMRDAVRTVLGRMDSPLQSCTTLHMVSNPFWHHLDNAMPILEDVIKIQAFKWWKDIVFKLTSLTAFASTDPHFSVAASSTLVLAKSRNSTKTETLFQVFRSTFKHCQALH